MMIYGWFRAADDELILRFRYDWESWDRTPMVLIERRSLESNGVPLLKNCKKM